MSLMRQGAVLREYDPKRGISVATLKYEYPAGFEVTEHAHGSDQLIYATRGVMEVRSGNGLWLIPPQFALWIPARTFHSIRMLAAVSMRTLYFRPNLNAHSRQSCEVLSISPLLRELIVETVRVGRLRTRNRHECALRDLILLHLSQADATPTFIRLPEDARAAAAARAVIDNPARPWPLPALCVEAGASVRTMQRIFQKEVGIDFETWRRHVRLTKAVELLVSGRTVKEVSFAVGYRQPSAFVEAFRRTFGATPKAWAAGLDKAAQGRPDAARNRVTASHSARIRT
jgi:AraC-like DNA-binding protein/quercetin dioxygenase-like cupin family protein